MVIVKLGKTSQQVQVALTKAEIRAVVRTVGMAPVEVVAARCSAHGRHLARACTRMRQAMNARPKALRPRVSGDTL